MNSRSKMAIGIVVAIALVVFLTGWKENFGRPALKKKSSESLIVVKSHWPWPGYDTYLWDKPDCVLSGPDKFVMVSSKEGRVLTISRWRQDGVGVSYPIDRIYFDYGPTFNGKDDDWQRKAALIFTEKKREFQVDRFIPGLR